MVVLERSAGRELASSRLRYQLVKLVVILVSLPSLSPVEAAGQLLSFGSSSGHTSSHASVSESLHKEEPRGSKEGNDIHWK